MADLPTDRDLHRVDAEHAIRDAKLAVRALTHLAIAATLHTAVETGSDDEQDLRRALSVAFGHEHAALRIIECLGEIAVGLPASEPDT
jgi:hypothetical protein